MPRRLLQRLHLRHHQPGVHLEPLPRHRQRRQPRWLLDRHRARRRPSRPGRHRSPRPLVPQLAHRRPGAGRRRLVQHAAGELLDRRCSLPHGAEGVRAVSAEGRGDGTNQGERGAVALITALLVFVILGMAAFAVDFGWIYVQSLNAKKAAESASLAGAVYLPLPTGVALAGSEAETAALEIAASHGYSSGLVTVSYGATDAQLKVQIDTSTDTFFMQAFGIAQATISRFATAESLPPLKLGSDEPFLGGPGESFWVALNGDRRRKEDGDPFSTACYLATSGSYCTNPVTNGEYEPDPNYFYAVEVPESEEGESLTIDVYDGPHYDPRWYTAGAPGDREDADHTQITFEVLAPDETPFDWTDNTATVCTYSFVNAPNASTPGVNQWVTVCSDTAIKGIYVLKVTIGCVAPCTASERDSITDFALRARVNGSSANNTAVYGLGAMSLDMVDVGTNPTFQLADLLPVYKGAELLVSLFDAGDATGNADLVFGGSLATVECQYRVRSGASGQIVGPWLADDSSGAPCELDTSGQRFNNQWVDFRFPIAPTYDCDPAAPSGDADSCWVLVDYDFAGASSVTERTTWQGRI
ncbi:MAG: pilus assembly protein, partial [Actinobacteria bacterium]